MKDPAFLFYSSDFIVGTLMMTDKEVGQYIRVLCLMHQKGRLSEKDINNSTKTKVLPSVLGKFKKDENNLYYNERLETESNKRSKFTESRRANAKHMPKHMEDVNEDVNVNSIKNTYGEFKNVFLSDEEYKNLTSYCLTENNLMLLIGDLSIYIRNKKKDPYIDHYATLQGWWRRKAVEHINKPTKGKQIIGL